MAETNQNTTKIVDLKLKGSEALSTIEKLTKELEAQKNRLRELNEQAKESGELSKAERDEKQLIIATSKQLQKELSAQNKVLQNSVAESRASATSLKELRAQYNNLKTTYEDLDEIQRAALIPQMREIKDRIEEADKAVGNYSSSIGGYEDAITNALPGFGRFQKVIQGLGIDATATARVMAQNVVTSLKSVGATMKALMANPLIAGIAVILATILAIREAIGKNQEAMDALQKIFAPFKLIVDAFFRGLGQVIGVIVDGISKFIEFIVPANGYLEKSIESQKTLQRLREAEIADIEETAAGNRRIAELKDKIAAKDKFSAEERRKFAEEVKREIEIQMKGEQERANLRLKAFEQENAIALKNKTLTAEERREYAELKAAIDKVTESNLNRAKEATAAVAETAAAIKAEQTTIENSEKEKRKAYAETARRRRELELSVNQQLEDIANSLISSEREREIAEAESKFNRNRAAIQKRLKDGVDLTAKSRADLSAILKLIDEREKAEISQINKRFADEELQARIAEKTAEFNRLRELEDGIARYEAQRQLDEAALKLERRRVELNNEFELERELAQAQNEMLMNLDEAAKDAMFETQEAYELAVLQSNERVKMANSDLRKSEIEKAQQLLAGISSVAGGLSQVFGQLAGKSKAMQTFQKALGMVQIITDSAVGVAGAIKAGAGLTFPANIPAIAAGVGAVLSGITSAIATLKGAGDVPIPAELRSGSGGGSYSSSAGVPSAPTPNYTTTTFSLGNSDTSARVSNSNQAEEIKAAIKEAYSEVPAPIVRVTDIQSAADSAQNIRNISVI